MNAPAININKPVRDQVSREEWAVRVNLAACYRLMAEYGMVEMVANHISARVPGTENEFLINPYGMLYEEMTASELSMPPNEVVQYTNKQLLPGNRRRAGLLEWPAMLRKLDRKDPSYAE